MEGDFNLYNKWIFRHVAVNKLYKIGYIPEDQYSKKGSTAEDSKLNNRLTMDLSRQLRQPLVAVSADANKCYNRINHIIMSLLLLALGGMKDQYKHCCRAFKVCDFSNEQGEETQTRSWGIDQAPIHCKDYVKATEQPQHAG
jgi:hypothetical protein